MTDAYQDLTEEEKKDFDSFLKQRAAKEIEIWEPWWNHR